MVAVSVLAAQAGVQLRVQPGSGGHRIGVGDRFYIIYTLTNNDQEPPAPASVPGAKLMYMTLTGQSSSFTSVNGKTSQSVAYTYTATCRAEKEGTFSFGPVMVGGEKSNAVSYQIVSAAEARSGQQQPHSNSAASQSGSGSRYDPYSRSSRNVDEPEFIGKGNDKLFLRASLNKTTAYEQEALVYTVKLYSTYSPIKFIGATDAPKFDGFVIEESDETSRSLTYETYQGQQYATAIIARYIIFPQMPGKLTIKGNTYTVSTDEREYYSDPYYSTMTVRRPIQLNVSPNDLTVTVNPLPQPRPADFSGGVGQFKLTSSLGAGPFKSNQASSIVYEIQGSGNLKYIHLPDLNTLYPKQLEVYSPTVDAKTKTGMSNVSGTVSMDYSFMPLEAGSFDIPAVTLSYFNPQTGRYEKSVAQGYHIQVDRGTESVKSQTRSTRSFDRQIINPGKLVKYRVPYISTWWYWACYIVPALVLGFIVWYYRKTVALKADEMGLRSRKAGKMAARRLRKAAAAMKGNNPELFYTEMLKALWGYVSDKLYIPTSELSRDNVAGLLDSHGIPDEDSKALISLIDDCEMAKYSPQMTGTPLADTYARGEKILDTLEAIFKKNTASTRVKGHM